MFLRLAAVVSLVLLASCSKNNLQSDSQLPIASPPLENEKAYRLWAGEAPGQQGETAKDIPIVTAFLPEPGKATGAAFIVCAGGAYQNLANHEGPVVAKWLADHGVTAFDLRYRLGPKYNFPCELDDAQRALRFVRANAKNWGLDPNRIGIMGFSAGGHLASTASTHFASINPKSLDPLDRVASKPNLSILIYPVITMGTGTHSGSRANLLGRTPTPEMIEYLSNEKQVTQETPKTFLMHSEKDEAVPVSNSDNYAAALKAAGIEYEYVRLPQGRHGVGLTDEWTPQCLKFLAKNGFIKE